MHTTEGAIVASCVDGIPTEVVFDGALVPAVVVHDGIAPGPWYDLDGALPDLDDPATLGCLLALVREDWNDPHIYVRKSVTRNQWVAWRKRLRDDDDEVKVSEGRTEDESLVAALEAAPRREAAPC